MKKIKEWALRFFWCRLLGNHEYRLIKIYSKNVQKLQCIKCNQYFGIHHELEVVLPWDGELEKMEELLTTQKK